MFDQFSGTDFTYGEEIRFQVAMQIHKYVRVIIMVTI